MWWKKKSSRQSRDDEIARDQALTAGRKNYFMVGPQCFNEEQMGQLKAFVDDNSVSAAVHSDKSYGELKDIRRTKGRPIHNDDTHAWVYEIITRVFTSANQELQYDIIPSMSDPIQLLRYDGQDQSFFVWHADTVPSDMTRKITIVVPLNDPREYEGGKVQFIQGSTAEVVQVPGVPVVFPSWLMHQVTPVTAGKRYSLVAWARGPNWR